MSRKLTLQSIEPLTHDVHHLVFDKPEGLKFTPGQAIDMALDRDGWREEKRPFTFTSLPGEGTLEFVIKSYPESADGHDGVTERIGKMQPGDTVLVEEPWGAIEDKGDGVFIAGGAGVTPFIAILRKKLAENARLRATRWCFPIRPRPTSSCARASSRWPGSTHVSSSPTKSRARCTAKRSTRTCLRAWSLPIAMFAMSAGRTRCWMTWPRR